MPVSILALANDFPVRDIERGKKGGRAVAHIVVRHRAGAAFLQGQTWLRAIQSLHLALLVTAQDDRVLRRVEIQTNDIFDFFGETRVIRDFEGARQMWLQAVFAPDAANRAWAHTQLFGHGLATPMSRRLGRFLGRHPDNEPPGFRRVSVFAPPAWLVGLNTHPPKLQKTAAPPGDFLPRDFQFLCNLIVSLSARRQEHHKTSFAQTLGSQSAFDRLGQPVAVFLSQMHGRSNSHGA